MPIKPEAAPYSAPARPELTGGKSVGVLLSHGFTGSPYSMRPWGEFLADKGYAVEVPRLPGHGTTWQEANATCWDDWYGEVSRAFDKLVTENDAVVLGGLSMGGSLVLRLAVDRPDDVAGIVLVNPAVNSADRRLMLLPVLRRLVRGFPGIGNDVKKPGVDEYCYPRTPLVALASLLGGWKLLRPELSKVTAPVLLFKSSVDHVVDPSSASIIKESIGTLEEVLLEDSWHVATLDNDAQTIFDESLKFVQTVTA